MSNKRLDLSVLPDGFLIEQDKAIKGRDKWTEGVNHFLMDDDLRETMSFSRKYRPALNYWHFNDGSMVLPYGLVVSVRLANGKAITGSTQEGFEGILLSYGGKRQVLYDLAWDINGGYIGHNVTAIKILGVHQDYADHGKELGMEVVEI